MAGLRDLWAAVTGRRTEPVAPPSMLPPVPTTQDLLGVVDTIEKEILAKAAEGRVHGVIAARVSDICATARDTIPRLDALGGGSRDAHSVMATVTSYLPEALGTYLRLPRDYADKRPIEGSKTALMVLVDQLDLLNTTMDRLLDAAVRRDTEALVAHGKFLADKFGKGSGSLDLPGTT